MVKPASSRVHSETTLQILCNIKCCLTRSVACVKLMTANIHHRCICLHICLCFTALSTAESRKIMTMAKRFVLKRGYLCYITPYCVFIVLQHIYYLYLHCFFFLSKPVMSGFATLLQSHGKKKKMQFYICSSCS